MKNCLLFLNQDLSNFFLLKRNTKNNDLKIKTPNTCPLSNAQTHDLNLNAKKHFDLHRTHT